MKPDLSPERVMPWIAAACIVGLFALLVLIFANGGRL